MADIFNSRMGYVSVLKGQNVVPGRVKIGEFDPKAVLISGVNYTQATNQQFQYALDNSVYVYVFGDKMGDVEVIGMAFPALCGEAIDGLSEILQFYAERRASKTEALVNVVVGDETVNGFLCSVWTRAIVGSGDEGGPVHQWGLKILTLPKE